MSGGFLLPSGDPESNENDKADVQDEHHEVKMAQFHDESLLQTKTLSGHVSDDGVSEGLPHSAFLLGCKPQRDGDDDRAFEEVIARWARPLGIFKEAVCILRQRPRIACRLNQWMPGNPLAQSFSIRSPLTDRINSGIRDVAPSTPIYLD